MKDKGIQDDLVRNRLVALAFDALESNDVCSKWKERIRAIVSDGFTKQKMIKGKWYLEAEEGCLITPVSDSRVYGHHRPNHKLQEWDWANRSQYFLKELEGKELADKLAEYQALCNKS